MGCYRKISATLDEKAQGTSQILAMTARQTSDLTSYNNIQCRPPGPFAASQTSQVRS